MPHNGVLSAAAIESTIDNAKPKEIKIVTDKIPVNTSNENDKSENNKEILLPITNISSEQPQPISDKVVVAKINEENKEESSEEPKSSGTTADTHDSPQSSKKDCNYSIVQNMDDHNIKEQPSKENEQDSNRVESKDGDMPSQKAIPNQDDNGHVVLVSSDGDGKGVSSLIRPNECLDDSDDGPAKKRQRLCALEDQESVDGVKGSKELSVTSEVKLQ